VTVLLDRADVAVHHADHVELLASLPRRDDGTVCDALIVDAPYSEKTHAGHDAGADRANGSEELPVVRDNRKRLALGVRAVRRQIVYPAWTGANVDSFVDAWAPLTRGWIVSITDDVLARAWQRAFERCGRYAFSPIACVESGSRVRLVGDGPSQWSTWATIGTPLCDEMPVSRVAPARPRNAEFSRWGTLQGAYVVPPGHGDGKLRDVVGGKPLWLMEALVRDYTRPGDLVCDPCCGAGTTLLAALRNGRRAVGGDAMLEHAELAAKQCGGMVQRPLFGEAAE
jgi:hypothetical protein